ncbi:unnamed protein product [Owenia fusiformis]|uniref:Uncharacterized protein n=1 Tax=Owenia fusiformis TaxID=6347 RepID=A0A8J1Y5U0_OWEFU|nr:unnamed protein product [Owenia fusiformis]
MGISQNFCVSGDVEDFICYICLDIFDKPVETSCKHIFCNTCILKRLITKKRECPICSSRMSKVTKVPSDGFYEKYNKLEMRCSFKCGHIGLLGDRDEHLNLKCPSVKTTCPNISIGCKIFVKRKQLDDHIRTCRYRYVTCEACDHKTQYLDLFTHQKVTGCFEKKLKQELVQNARTISANVRKHRMELKQEEMLKQQNEMKREHQKTCPRGDESDRQSPRLRRSGASPRRSPRRSPRALADKSDKPLLQSYIESDREHLKQDDEMYLEMIIGSNNSLHTAKDGDDYLAMDTYAQFDRGEFDPTPSPFAQSPMAPLCSRCNKTFTINTTKSCAWHKGVNSY